MVLKLFGVDLESTTPSTTQDYILHLNNGVSGHSMATAVSHPSLSCHTISIASVLQHGTLVDTYCSSHRSSSSSASSPPPSNSSCWRRLSRSSSRRMSRRALSAARRSAVDWPAGACGGAAGSAPCTMTLVSRCSAQYTAPRAHAWGRARGAAMQLVWWQPCLLPLCLTTTTSGALRGRKAKARTALQVHA